MTTVFAHDMKKYTPKTSLIGNSKHTKISLYIPEDNENDKEIEEGDGLLSGLGSIAKTGFNFIKTNKDIISNVAKGIGSVGLAASAIASAVESSKKKDQIKLIKQMREKALSDQKKKMTEKQKQQLGSALVTVN